jgi:hypothetical protein
MASLAITPLITSCGNSSMMKSYGLYYNKMLHLGKPFMAFAPLLENTNYTVYGSTFWLTPDGLEGWY